MTAVRGKQPPEEMLKSKYIDGRAVEYVKPLGRRSLVLRSR